MSQPLFRGANADFNMTLAMAMVFFVMWTVWAMQANGFGGFIMHLFGPKGETKGLLKVLMVVIFLLVGARMVSILFRPNCLKFSSLWQRVRRRKHAGSRWRTWWINRHGCTRLCAIIIPIPFYFMEIFVGLIQALVFMLLTACFHPPHLPA